MASTYSALKIELIATGEQSSIWGTTTNTNLGTALEEAIVGRATANFTADADLTISLTNNNATQVARNYILNVTGALTATRDLIVPTTDKPYIIENNTTGSQSIRVKTTAGTGITVPNGKTAMVYANSTNVVSAVSYIPAATIDTATIAAGTATFSAATITTATINGGTITGITDLAVADGGTGLSTLTANNVILGNGASAPTFVAPGLTGRVLTSNGTTWTSAAPAAPGVGTVTSVAASVPSVLSISGSPITSAGTLAITYSGTALPLANGGTAGTSASAARTSLAVPGLAVANTFTGDNAVTAGAGVGRLSIGTANPSSTGANSWSFYSKGYLANPAGVFFNDTASGTCTSHVITSTAGQLAGFYYGTSITSYSGVGSITTNGSVVTYGGTSDYRLKQNVISLTGGLDRVMKLRPVHHEWINNPALGLVDGFIAHEVAEVVPAAVVGAKDAVDEKGAIKPQMMDASKLIPILTAALQEQQSLISALTERILALEAK